MKKKDIKLFNKTIHEVKRVLSEISEERKEYHLIEAQRRKERRERRKKHDKAVKKQIRELLEVVDDLYELFADLSNGKEYCKCKNIKTRPKFAKYCSFCGKQIKN
jgi:molecular chaperone GrpE (heat shock protein)